MSAAMLPDDAVDEAVAASSSLVVGHRLVGPSYAEARRSPVFGFVVSIALHLVPIIGLALGIQASEPAVGFGDDAMDVEVVLAEAAIDLPDVPQPDGPRFDMAAAIPEAVVAEQRPQKAGEDVPLRADDAMPDVTLPPHGESAPPAPPVQLASLAAEAPVVVQEESRSAMSDAYRAKVARHVARFKRFPGNAARNLAKGKVLVAFDLSPQGAVLQVALLQSSGVPAFDDEAIAMVRRAQPFPVETRGGQSKLSFVLPVSYRLRD